MSFFFQIVVVHVSHHSDYSRFVLYLSSQVRIICRYVSREICMYIGSTQSQERRSNQKGSDRTPFGSRPKKRKVTLLKNSLRNSGASSTLDHLQSTINQNQLKKLNYQAAESIILYTWCLAGVLNDIINQSINQISGATIISKARLAYRNRTNSITGSCVHETNCTLEDWIFILY